MYEHGLLAPAVALVAWSLVVLVWLYATRIPAMRKAKINPEKAKGTNVLETLPAGVRSVADNYNHLMEQPTLFYAVCFALQLLEQTQPINIGLAWTYVALRVAHSLVQNLGNVIMLRFFIFVLSTLVLATLTVHAMATTGMLSLSLPH